MNYLKDFMKYYKKLPPIEQIGVATVLQVKIYYDIDRKNPKDQDLILSEIINKFEALPENRKNTLILLMKTAVKGGKI